MRKLIILPILLLVSFVAKADFYSYPAGYIQTGAIYWDDTALVQGIFNTGGTLSIGHTYFVSATLSLFHNVNMNSASIVMSAGGNIINIVNPSIKLSNGIVSGNWNYTTARRPTGSQSGIGIYSNHDTLDNIHVLSVDNYGVVCSGAVIRPVIINSWIEKTGYICFYFDPEATSPSGGVFYNNLCDRSMISAATVQQLAVGIRGSTSSGLVTSNWRITHNTIKMPLNPTDGTAECMEVRNITNSRIDSNSCTNGSLGISALNMSLDTVSYNHITGAKGQNLEIGSSQNCIASFNIISGGTGVGILMDGTIPCKNNLLLNDTVTTSNSALQCYIGTIFLTITNCSFSTTASQKIINLQKSYSLTINNTSLDGGSFAGSTGIYLDNSQGFINYTGGSITHATNQIYGFNNGLDSVVDHIHFINVTSTATQKNQTFSNGAHWGGDVTFTFNTFVFNPIPAKTYGNADFNPGATSTLTITYSSSNTSIATIVSGNVHIVGTGTVNITATTTDTAAMQPLTINKAALSVMANNASKTYGQTLTGGSGSTAFTSSGLQYGQSIGTINISYGTGAVPTAAVNTYVNSVTPSAAIGGTFSTSNYNITYINGNIIVGKSALTITADNKTKIHNTANPALTASYSGFQNGETNSVLTTQPTITTTALLASPIGIYPITASGAIGANYNISYTAGTLTITGALMVFNAIPDRTYGAADFNPGAVSATSITYSSSNTSVATIVSGNIHILAVGSSNITADNGDTTIMQPFTVNKAPLSITADNFVRVFGVPNPTFTATYTGFVYGETHTVLTTQPTLSTTATSLSPAGSYAITNSGATASNYTITNHNGTLIITPILTGGSFTKKGRKPILVNYR